MKCKLQIIIVGLVIPAVAISLLPSKAFGQVSTNINATIRISVCGNDIAEGGEDCDNNDFKYKSCQSLGYGGGTLSCDISCSYNTSACVAVTATPTLILIPSPTLTQTPPVSTIVEPTAIPLINTPTQYPRAETAPLTPNKFAFFHGKDTPKLPPGLKYFDLDGTGKISSNQLHTVISLWVNAWKQYLAQDTQQKSKTKDFVCDINYNGSCNLDDFSILLYYVER